MQERNREGQSLLLPAAEFADEAREHRAQADTFGKLGGCRRDVVIRGVEFQNLANRRLFRQRRRLQLHADQLAQLSKIGTHRRIEPEDPYATGGRARQSDARFERRGLPGPVSPEKPERAAARDVEADPGDGRHRSESLDQCLDRNRRLTHPEHRRLPAAVRCER